jgi:hypothetical protein
MQELNFVIDEAKQMLVDLGDSPFSMPCQSLGRQNVTIKGT